MKKIIFIIYVVCNFKVFSSSLEWVSTGNMTTIACVNFCFNPCPNDTTFYRGNGLCLWAHIDLSSADEGKIWKQQVIDSSDRVVFENLLKIKYDKEDVCFDGNKPDVFPNGYGVYYYDSANKKYFLKYCLKKDSDGKYNLIGDFDPAGCGMTDCSTHLGHYSYLFYEDDNYKDMATFWIGPDTNTFNPYYDVLNLSGCYNLSLCTTNENGNFLFSEPECYITGNIRCGNDWNGASYKIKRGLYQTIWQENSNIKNVAHFKHYFDEFPFNPKDSRGSCNDAASSFGYIENIEGNLSSGNLRIRLYPPTLAGRYEYTFEIKENFDGREFIITNDLKQNMRISGMESALSCAGESFVWQENDPDIHYPENTYMLQSSLNEANYLFKKFLELYVWNNYPNAKLRLTDANLNGGGFFDHPGSSGNAPPWGRAHHTHRLGISLDVSLVTKDGPYLDNTLRTQLIDLVDERRLNNNTFCRYETQQNPHIHCDFY